MKAPVIYLALATFSTSAPADFSSGRARAVCADSIQGQYQLLLEDTFIAEATRITLSRYQARSRQWMEIASGDVFEIPPRSVSSSFELDGKLFTGQEFSLNRIRFERNHLWVDEAELKINLGSRRETLRFICSTTE